VGVDLRHTPSVEALACTLERELPRLDYLINNACQTVRRPPAFFDHLLAAETQPVEELTEEMHTLVERSAYLQSFERPRHTHASKPEDGRLLAATTRSHRPGDGNSDPLRGPPLTGTHPLPTRDPRSHGRASSLGDETPPPSSVALSQLHLLAEDFDRDPGIFPGGFLDEDEQQVDLRTHNSWRMGLSDVPTIELLECTLVNAIAPFVLTSRLLPLMRRTPAHDKHIVEVSAMEGQFSRGTKTDKHPHTNMAKAALNMLVRTSAQDCIRHGIHLNAVDTGWVTDEDPAQHAARKADELGFSPPLDTIDGAARIVDPIFDGLCRGRLRWGQFLKDFEPTAW